MEVKERGVSSSTRFFFGTSMAHFVNDGNFLMFPLLIVYYGDLHIGLLILGSGAIIESLISGFLSTPIGVLADSMDDDRLLIFLGLAIQSAALAVFGITFKAPQYGVILILLGTCLLGLGQSFYHPLGSSVLTLVYPQGKFEIFLGLNGSIASTGRAISPLIIGALVATLGYTNGLYSLALYMLIASFLVYYTLSTFRRADYRKVQKQHRVENVAKHSLSGFGWFLFVLTALIFVRSMFTSAITTFLPEYLSKYLGSGTYLTEILSVILIPAIFGQVFLARLTARKGGAVVVSVTSIISVLAFFVFMQTSDILIMLISLAIFAISVYNTFPVVLGYIGQIVPHEYISTANSLVWGVGATVGGAAGIAVATALIILTNLTISFYIMLLLGVISSILLTVMWLRQPKNVNKERGFSD